MSVAKEVGENLGKFPRGLDAIYAGIWNDIQAQSGRGPAIARTAFMWIFCACQPLFPNQLAELVSMHCFGNRISIKIDNVLKCCRNLLVLDEQLDAIRFAHTSVLEYLEQNEIVNQTDAHSMASDICVSILAEMKEPLIISTAHNYESSRRPGCLLYSIYFWLTHVRNCGRVCTGKPWTESLTKFLTPPSQAYEYWYTTMKVNDLSTKDIPYYGLQRFDSDATPSLFAATYYGLDCIEEDLWRKHVNEVNSDQQTLLFMAVLGSQVEMIRKLLRAGANVNTRDKEGQTALLAALDSPLTVPGITELVVQLLLDAGADIHAPDNYGRTALHVAAENSNSSIIHLLLDAGADIHAPDKDGRTALHVAAENRNSSIIHLLLDAGADIEAKDNRGRTTLHLAPSAYSIIITHLLLDAGADIEAKDNRGRTTLHLAASGDSSDITHLLLDAGADIDARDNAGRTPLDLAIAGVSRFDERKHYRRRRQSSVVKLLMDYGAKANVEDMSKLEQEFKTGEISWH